MGMIDVDVKVRSQVRILNGKTLADLANLAIEAGTVGKGYAFDRGTEWDSDNSQRSGAIAFQSKLVAQIRDAGHIVAASSKLTTADVVVVKVFGSSSPVA